ncbi:MAG: hypothetical protein AAF703_02865 [Cyanobacteria bacterium P01_D01_bin.105]
MTTGKPEQDELYELRSLLLNGDPDQLLNSAVTPESVSQVLPAALIEAQRQQPDLLTSAVVTTVETAIHASVHQDSHVLANSLFPIIGPSTRKSIAAAIGELIQSLNQTLEYSLSWRSLKWRLEARRTGKSFAEIVLLRTLIYQVEQVFLIHRETGLVLQHVTAKHLAAKQSAPQDPDLVSAMLTAIQDFVHDSFKVNQGDSLSVLEFGDLRIWLEEGPHAMLACVIRGSAPNTLHTTMQTAQEQIHRLFTTALQSFDGDAAVFEASKPYLQDCFQSQFKQQTTRKQIPFALTQKQKIAGGLLASCLLLGLITWRVLSWQAHQRWTNYVAMLEKAPGIVVINQQKRSGRYRLQGLKDPLAEEPIKMLENTNIPPDKVDMNWQPYLSLDKSFIGHRLQALLDPPPTVSMTLDQSGVLQLKGSAPTRWIDWAKEVSDRTDGITGWDSRRLIAIEGPLPADANRQPSYFNAD